MGNPAVAIVVLTYNGYELVKDCLIGLNSIQYSNKKIFLVDNCSDSPGETEKLKSLSNYYDDLIQIKNRNRGFGEGMNYGIRKALEAGDFKYVLCCSNDIVPSKDFLDHLVMEMEDDNKLGIVGPVQYHYNSDLKLDKIYFAGGIITKISNLPLHVRNITDVPRVDYINGTIFLIRSETFTDTGGFDWEYYNWYEDCDLSLRAKKNGWGLAISKKSIIWHKVAQTVAPTTDALYLHSIYYHARNRILFVKKNKPKIIYILFSLYFISFGTLFGDIWSHKGILQDAIWPRVRPIRRQREDIKNFKFFFNIVINQYKGIFNALLIKPSPNSLAVIPG